MQGLCARGSVQVSGSFFSACGRLQRTTSGASILILVTVAIFQHGQFAELFTFAWEEYDLRRLEQQ